MAETVSVIELLFSFTCTGNSKCSQDLHSVFQRHLILDRPSFILQCKVCMVKINKQIILPLSVHKEQNAYSLNSQKMPFFSSA